MHQLILLTNTFFNPVVRCKEKTHTCHATKEVASKVVKKYLARYNRPIFKTLTSAFLWIFN